MIIFISPGPCMPHATHTFVLTGFSSRACLLLNKTPKSLGFG